MATSTRAVPLWSSILLAFFLLWACVEATPSIPMDYCSTINTASMAANHSIYQSDGLCSTFCAPKFALAIVQEENCWCSNFVPSKEIQVSTSKCNKSCPGFPDDVCGGDGGYYGYMLLNIKPSGTTGASSSTSSTSSAKVTTTTVQNTVQNTVTVDPPPPSSSETSSSDSSTTTTTPSKTTDDNTSQTSETPTVTTLTTGGQTKTVTVTPVTPSATNSVNAGGISVDPQPTTAAKHGLSAGAAAGIAVAVIIAFLFVGGMLAWLFIKRRRAAQREEAAASGAGGGGPSKFSSNRASSGTGMTGPGGSPRTGEMSETRYYMGSNSQHPPAPERRRSTLMPVDPRLDPFAKGIYNRAENKSHDSVNTIRDDHDYSRKIQDPPRVLRAVNPDSDID